MVPSVNDDEIKPCGCSMPRSRAYRTRRPLPSNDNVYDRTGTRIEQRTMVREEFPMESGTYRVRPSGGQDDRQFEPSSASFELTTAEKPLVDNQRPTQSVKISNNDSYLGGRHSYTKPTVDNIIMSRVESFCNRKLQAMGTCVCPSQCPVHPNGPAKHYESVGVGGLPSENQAFTSYRQPSTDYEPPPPPPEGRDDLWDLQFCRWWGWNWVKRRETIAAHVKTSCDRPKARKSCGSAPSEDETICSNAPKKKSARKTCKGPSCFQAFIQSICTPGRPLKRPQRDLVKHYDTPCNSVAVIKPPPPARRKKSCLSSKTVCGSRRYRPKADASSWIKSRETSSDEECCRCHQKRHRGGGTPHRIQKSCSIRIQNNSKWRERSNSSSTVIEDQHSPSMRKQKNKMCCTERHPNHSERRRVSSYSKRQSNSEDSLDYLGMRMQNVSSDICYVIPQYFRPCNCEIHQPQPEFQQVTKRNSTRSQCTCTSCNCLTTGCQTDCAGGMHHNGRKKGKYVMMPPWGMSGGGFGGCQEICCPCKDKMVERKRSILRTSEKEVATVDMQDDPAPSKSKVEPRHSSISVQHSKIDKKPSRDSGLGGPTLKKSTTNFPSVESLLLNKYLEDKPVLWDKEFSPMSRRRTIPARVGNLPNPIDPSDDIIYLTKLENLVENSSNEHNFLMQAVFDTILQSNNPNTSSAVLSELLQSSCTFPSSFQATTPVFRNTDSLLLDVNNNNNCDPFHLNSDSKPSEQEEEVEEEQGADCRFNLFKYHLNVFGNLNQTDPLQSLLTDSQDTPPEPFDYNSFFDNVSGFVQQTTLIPQESTTGNTNLLQRFNAQRTTATFTKTGLLSYECAQQFRSNKRRTTNKSQPKVKRMKKAQKKDGGYNWTDATDNGFSSKDSNGAIPKHRYDNNDHTE